MAEAGDAAGLEAEEILARVKSLEYGSSYIWVHTFHPGRPNQVEMVMHPTWPTLDGTDISDFVDKKKFEKIAYDGEIYGKNDPKVAHIEETNLFVDMNAVCAESGEGTVLYYWPKPKGGGGTTEAGYGKLSFVKLYPKHN